MPRTIMQYLYTPKSHTLQKCRSIGGTENVSFKQILILDLILKGEHANKHIWYDQNGERIRTVRLGILSTWEKNHIYSLHICACCTSISPLI